MLNNHSTRKKWRSLTARGGLSLIHITGAKKHNMGIGLIVCRDIIKVHGGNCEGRNQLEGGTEFWFTLPLKEERQYGGHKG